MTAPDEIITVVKYYACDCNSTRPDGREPCTGRHTKDGVEQKTCPECGDVAETHYLKCAPRRYDEPGRLQFYMARRGHDDDDPDAADRCEGAEEATA